MPTQTPIAISAESLLSLPHEALIALYNLESRRLAGSSLDPHLVDETCKPKFIVGLFASLHRRYAMMYAERSNEMAAMQPLGGNETAGRKQSETERCMDNASLTRSNKPFELLR